MLGHDSSHAARTPANGSFERSNRGSREVPSQDGGPSHAMTDVVVFGTGSIARVARFLLDHDSPHEVVAHAVDRNHWHVGEFEGLPIVAFEDLPGLYPPGEFAMFVAVGYRRMNQFRAERYTQAKAMGYELVTYVSSRASTWPESQIGDNCMIMDQVVLEPFASVGNDVILWSGSHIGHDSVVGNHCYVASHVVIAGVVTVHESCFLGTNATIRDGVAVARECVIGAGAVINRDTDVRGVYAAPKPTLLPLPSNRLLKL